ncbi:MULTISPECIES: hypothetical protein [unclassified Neorhizobium]|uniref:cucumopine synthase-related protein n=1 Tax=unclassified Neorhizobium TaxID=2629175 RepID=UPI001FF2165B|nr:MULTISPECIES: hypothetical protein [unclassified Neorhizobium]MCJ9670379.1 hypothetical protein [Neorhizobium sp. SHOUNA12B]MCJ9746307.1 hypothetical protein [Neorhizobium sp. SHOUNA12A]
MASQQYANLTALIAAIEEATKHISSEQPTEVADLFSGKHENMIGTGGQFFSTGVFAFAYSLCDSINDWPNLAKWARDPEVSIDILLKLLKDLAQQNINYQGYNKFGSIQTFGQSVIDLSHAEPGNREEITRAISAFARHYNMFHQWMHQAFPWNVGTQPEFQYPNLTDAEPVEPDPSRRVKIEDGRVIELSYIKMYPDAPAENLPTLKAVLAVNENPELAQEWIDYLTNYDEMAVLMNAAMVSGGSIYGWAPILSRAAIQQKERQCDAPIGRIRYSPLTGNKIIIQDGPVTEGIETPVLGEVLPESLNDLDVVSKAIRDNTFAKNTQKAHIWVVITLA